MEDNITNLFVPGGKQIAGIVRGDTLDIRKHSHHYVKKYRAYAISPSTIEDAINAGAVNLQLTVIESGEVFTCSLDEFQKYAIPDSLGAGLQLFMPLSYFRWCKAHAPKYRNEPMKIEQMSFI